ncbi:TOBE domain-containing protein [Baaleninema simplex]|uniref:TOBE domain-containing protein n=1 Tax=Baaleninema simplex TaxID=2862350 RepID=UPI00034921E8|nr:molybdopterin-binding protein [Baaleninema simplex]
MKLTARNTLKGKVTKLVPGTVNSEITLEIAPGIEIVGIVSKASAERLELTDGKEAYAIIKSSNVMFAIE